MQRRRSSCCRSGSAVTKLLVRVLRSRRFGGFGGQRLRGGERAGRRTRSGQRLGARAQRRKLLLLGLASRVDGQARRHVRSGGSQALYCT
ncbi:hypothetical protein BDA96_10G214100, partial [Sorghum bicolor]